MEAADLDAEALVIGDGDVLPVGDLLLHLLVAPPAVDDLVLEAEAGVEVAVFAVAVRALVQVHIVEINRVVGDAVEVLRREVQQRLLQQHRAADPILRGGEGVHPGDDARDLVVVIDVFHELRDAVRRRHDALADDLVRQLAALVELVGDGLRVARDVSELLLAVEELRAGDEPEFIVSDLFHNGDFLSL